MIRQHSAGGAVYRSNSGKTEWLVVKPAGRDRWQLPKGWVDEGETPEVAAVREVKEEGGVKARLKDKIDTVTIFFFQDGKRVVKNIDFYLMEYVADTKDGHDQEVEEVVWLPYEEAYKKLTFKSEKEVLEKANKILSS